MKIVQPKVILENKCWKLVERKLERAGRVCYKSEDRITSDSAERFLKSIIKSGHESVLEQENLQVKFIIDRGISHQLVRHRLASYLQESTRYCNYSKGKFNNEIQIIDILPILEMTMLQENIPDVYDSWIAGVERAEEHYFELLDNGAPPELARNVLPTSLKTEIIVTANIREWRHILKLRTSHHSHPQIRQVMIPLLEELQKQSPVLFGDIPKDDDYEAILAKSAILEKSDFGKSAKIGNFEN